MKKLQCTMGAIQPPLMLLMDHGVYSGPDGQPLANVNDHIPLMNILTFGMCKTTLCPCVPVTPMAWMMGERKYVLDGAPVLTYDSRLVCMLGGMITVQK